MTPKTPTIPPDVLPNARCFTPPKRCDIFFEYSSGIFHIPKFRKNVVEEKTWNIPYSITEKKKLWNEKLENSIRRCHKCEYSIFQEKSNIVVPWIFWMFLEYSIFQINEFFFVAQILWNIPKCRFTYSMEYIPYSKWALSYGDVMFNKVTNGRRSS